MKTAILIPGFLRFHKECFENFQENIYKPFKSIGEVDIFSSTWTNIIPQHFGAHQHGHLSPELPLVDVEEFRNLYNPTELEIEDFAATKEKLKLKNFCNINEIIDEIWNWKEWYNGVLNTTCQFYKIYKTNQLKINYEQKNGFKYDFVLKYRSDALAPKPIPVDKLIKNTLYLVDYGHDSRMVNDTIWLSDSKTNDYICSLYERFVYFYQNAKELKHGFAIEKMLYIHTEPLLKECIRLAEFGLMDAKWKWYGRK